MPKNAARILDLNGRTKIKLIGDYALAVSICEAALIAKSTQQDIAHFVELRYYISRGNFVDQLVDF